jgi:hypothetical protein
MHRSLYLGAVAALLIHIGAVRAGDLPAFELTDFPISPHQISVLGSAAVKEEPAAPLIMFDSMSIAPQQLVVLTPRPRVTSATANLVIP